MGELHKVRGTEQGVEKTAALGLPAYTAGRFAAIFTRRPVTALPDTWA